MLKDDFGYIVLFLCIGLSAIWAFLVFFPFILVGTVILISCGVLGATLYEVYQGLTLVQHKLYDVTHNKKVT